MHSRTVRFGGVALIALAGILTWFLFQPRQTECPDAAALQQLVEASLRGEAYVHSGSSEGGPAVGCVSQGHQWVLDGGFALRTAEEVADGVMGAVLGQLQEKGALVLGSNRMDLLEESVGFQILYSRGRLRGVVAFRVLERCGRSVQTYIQIESAEFLE